jgi:hypothetical protein
MPSDTLPKCRGVTVTEFGFYYPHVHFRDAKWLMLSAFYWERIYRLYGGNVGTSMPNISFAEAALYDAGVVKHVMPSMDDLERVERRFISALAGLDLRPYQTQTQIRTGESLRETLGMGIALWQKDYAPFHNILASWKASPTLVEKLIDLRLAVPVGSTHLWMKSFLVEMYLLSMATEIAPAYGALPVTDDEVLFGASGVTLRRIARGVSGQRPEKVDATERAALLANLSVNAVVPRDVTGVPVSKIIEFRNRYAGERVRFRNGIADMLRDATDLEGIRDREILLEHLQVRFDTYIQPALTDLDKALRGLRIDTRLGAINIQAAVPSVATSVLAILALHPAARTSAAIGLGGFAIGVWRSVQQADQQRTRALTASPVAYLHHLQTDLAPASLAERIRCARCLFAPPQTPYVRLKRSNRRKR